jgi:predicted helicase
MFYLYSIVYSSEYRKRWAEFLKYDMPRFPFPKDYSLFLELSKRGKELAKLHMLFPDTISKLDEDERASYPNLGSNIINMIRYDKKENEIRINKQQIFLNVKEDIWNFRIGGYQVLKQWLSRRRNKTLTSEEISNFCIIVAIIGKTLEFLDQINPLYNKLEENILEANRFKISLETF